MFEEAEIGEGKLKAAAAFAGGCEGRDIDIIAYADREGIGFQFDDGDNGITPTDIRAEVEDVIRLFKIVPQLIRNHYAANRFLCGALVRVIGLDGKTDIVIDDLMDACGEDDFRIEFDGWVGVEGIPWPVEVEIGAAEVEGIFVVGAKGGIEADAECSVEIVDIGVKDRLADGQGRIVGGAVVLVVGRHFGKIECLLYYAAHETNGQVHGPLDAQGFVIVEGRHDFRGRQCGGAGFVVEDLQAGGEEVAPFSDGPFVFAAEGPRPIGVIEAVPLVAEEGLDAIVAGEDACQRRVT